MMAALAPDSYFEMKEKLRKRMNAATERTISKLKHAVSGQLVRVAIDGQVWERTDYATRPVAFRFKCGDSWMLVEEEERAAGFAEALNVNYQGLYVRNYAEGQR